VAAALSDQAWAEICAAGGLTPDAEARAALAAVLFDEYPAFAYDRVRVATAYRRAARMLKHLNNFAANHRAQFAQADDIMTERDLFYIERLRRRALSVWLAARAIRRANKGKRNVQHEWMCHRLCTVWLDYFHAPGLSITHGGPLVRFMLAALRQVIPQEKLPKPETVRAGIKRERDERDNAAQLYLFALTSRETTRVD
jgi:hypothetical protein